MLEQYIVSEENPNRALGGSGGCLCSPLSCGDGPYLTFYNSDLFEPKCPHAVLCAGCALGAAGAVEREVGDAFG